MKCIEPLLCLLSTRENTENIINVPAVTKFITLLSSQQPKMTSGRLILPITIMTEFMEFILCTKYCSQFFTVSTHLILTMRRESWAEVGFLKHTAESDSTFSFSHSKSEILVFCFQLRELTILRQQDIPVGS